MNRLSPALLQRLPSSGQVLPFVEVMELFLYHPQVGYYMVQKPRLGREGDFVTAPEMTSLFGELLAQQFYEVWQRMGSPDGFQIVEVGGGSGVLAVDILTACRTLPEFFRAIHYHLVEISPDFRLRQQEILAGFPVSWHTNLDDLNDIRGVVFGNELLDAFPVHWLRLAASGWQEMGVCVDQECLVATPLDNPTPQVAAALSRLPADLPEGYETELGLPGESWVFLASQRLQQGILLFIDYGYPRHEYYHPARPQGTLVGYHQNQQIADPLAFPGEMDLTAHVDFTAMAEAGQRAGLSLLGYTSQSWFLLGLGLLQRLAAQEGVLAGEPLSRLRQSVMRLIMPGGMGERFQVLAMGRGLSAAPPLAGFAENNRLDRLFPT